MPETALTVHRRPWLPDAGGNRPAWEISPRPGGMRSSGNTLQRQLKLDFIPDGNPISS
jgi:hypothetical protein